MLLTPAKSDAIESKGWLVANWVLTVLWAAMVLGFSTSGFGGNSSRSWLAEILARAGLAVPAVAFNFLHACSRKFAHMAEYSILTVLLYRSLLAGRLAWDFRRARIAVFVAALCAAVDEVHQLFVPNRTGSFMDWSLDTAAAVTTMLMLTAVLASSESRNSNGT